MRTLTGVAGLDGFVPSLRLLVESEKYSLHDVALMFDVSRERIRQLCIRYGVAGGGRAYKTGLNAVRVWDDTQNRFAPIARGDISRAKKAERRAKFLSARLQRRQEHRAEIVATIQELAASSGRTPTLGEVCVRILGPGKSGFIAALAQRWGRENKTYAAATREMYEAAGFAPRRSGPRGHVSRLPYFGDDGMCKKKKHVLSEVGIYETRRDDGKVTRLCRACRNERQRNYRPSRPRAGNLV